MGFAHARFARNTLRHPFDPWQEWLAIHAGELLPDGRPRFRVILVLVARQNGKTELLVILCLYWQFVDAFPLILGTSTKLEYARESWDKSVKLAEDTEDFDELRGPRRWTKEGNAQQVSTTTERARYKIAASNEEGGRSLTLDRLVCDELRQHHDYSAWGACEEAASPRHAQIWALSNAGDARSVVLNDHRAEALAMIEYIDEHGHMDMAELMAAGHDPRLGLFEWSAPETADVTDLAALAQANPDMNRRSKDGEVLLSKARRAKRLGGDALASFQTESMCITVMRLDPAVDAAAWGRCLDPGTMASARSRLALCLDVAPDELHASLVAAAVLPDDRVRVEAVAAWEGAGCVDKMRRDLPGIVARVRPQVLGWLPAGPGAVLGADLKPREGRPSTFPRSVKVEEIRGELATVCMGLAEQVTAHKIAQSDDPLLNAHVLGAGKLKRAGDTWVFSRRLPSTKGAKSDETAEGDEATVVGHCDAAYATAGAVHLARTLPVPIGKPRLVVAE